MRSYSISTFRRFIYVNIYAFLILLMGIGIIFLPLSGLSEYLIYVQVLLALVCLKSSISIFNTWEAKKRRYKKLIDANKECFNPESFEEYMKAPCGRLLVKLVLDDLDEKRQYKKLKTYKISWIKTLKNNCKPRKRVKIVVYKNDV